MNPFFSREATAKAVPSRVYARTIDGEIEDPESQFVLFDAVGAEWFDRLLAETDGRILPELWRGISQQAPIYAVEVNVRRRLNVADVQPCLDRGRALPRWVELLLRPNPEGAAEVYLTITGPPQRADLELKPLAAKLRQALKTATDLGPYVHPDTAIIQALPKTDVDQIFVLDVGQGSANALIDNSGNVLGYVDLGAGVLADSGTWPSAMRGLCKKHPSTVILTHWHYDHFEAANIYHHTQKLTWPAPLQVLGPGPQSAMASALAIAGKLMVWGGTGSLASGRIELERCTGPSGNQNRTGVAVWINGPAAEDPILLPGDAGYMDIPSLSPGRAITSFAVAHHGGTAPGIPPRNPGKTHSRAAMSYGYQNSYGHPLGTANRRIKAAGWALGPFPGTRINERRTEDRPAGPGTGGLGHVRLRWSGSVQPNRNCSCGCTIDPTQ